MALGQISDWLDDFLNIDGWWYVKRLSGNDTQANGSHQAGPYIPRDFIFNSYPELNDHLTLNPRVKVRVIEPSGECSGIASIIWYNNKFFGHTRNEVRITGLGGRQSSLLDTENTGSIALFFFTGKEDKRECHYWVCRDIVEEDIAEAFAGPVDPGFPLFWSSFSSTLSRALTRPELQECWIDSSDMPAEWLKRFPTPRAVLDFALTLRPYNNLPVDSRILHRRICEYAIFKSVEYAIEYPVIAQGFQSIDSFVSRAQTILQRRKARSGRSLELQMCNLLNEESIRFSFEPTTESNKKPDFIIPSEDAYKDPCFPVGHLRMLAIKTTVRERWRQVLAEADRIPIKHLFTLQEGVSEQQFSQMAEANVKLVVPKALHRKYPKGIRSELMTLQDFIQDVRRFQN